MDFSKYKFRPSKLKDLMVDGRNTITPIQLKKLNELLDKSKTTQKQDEEIARLFAKKEKGYELSDTTKKALIEIYIAEVYGRIRDITNKFMEKGTLVEESSIDLLCEVTNRLYVKNTKKFQNDYLIGTPDIVAEDKVIDIKSSYDLWSFADSPNLQKAYYWQMMGYIWLTGKDVATLAFCLVTAPEHLIVQEKSRQTYIKGYMPETKEFVDLENQIDKNMRFEDMPIEKKLKCYDVPYSGYGIEKLTERLEQCRIYLQSIDL